LPPTLSHGCRCGTLLGAAPSKTSIYRHCNRQRRPKRVLPLRSTQLNDRARAVRASCRVAISDAQYLWRTRGSPTHQLVRSRWVNDRRLDRPSGWRESHAAEPCSPACSANLLLSCNVSAACLRPQSPRRLYDAKRGSLLPWRFTIDNVALAV